MDLDNFQTRFQEEVVRLCNQLLSGFSSIHFETLHSYNKHIEDVHVFFFAYKYIIFDKLTYRGLTGGFLLLQNFCVDISVSPHVCFILVLILISMFLR